ncbi:hypothetical protein, partial [Microcystis sp. M158S2]|uniref:hypothetical protein n=1 Tax=Microcystis sp. M158S2 TaxID=2771152 RepID=UPI00258ACFD6
PSPIPHPPSPIPHPPPKNFLVNVLEVWPEELEADRQIAILSNYRPEQGNYRFFQARIKDFVSKNTKTVKVTV